MIADNSLVPLRGRLGQVTFLDPCLAYKPDDLPASGSIHSSRLISARLLANQFEESAFRAYVCGAGRSVPSGPGYRACHRPEGSCRILPQSPLSRGLSQPTPGHGPTPLTWLYPYARLEIREITACHAPLTAAGGGFCSQGTWLPLPGSRSSRTQPWSPVTTLRRNVHVPRLRGCSTGSRRAGRVSPDRSVCRNCWDHCATSRSWPERSPSHRSPCLDS